MTKTAIVYCRTSTQGQKENETIGAQVERCKRLLDRHDLTPLPYGPSGDGWLIDDGVSGTLLDGRGMGQLLTDLDAQKVKPDYLVVYSLSRVSRVDRVSKSKDKVRESHVAAARIQAALVSSGTKVMDEDGEMDAGSIQFGIKALLANEEFKLIRARTMSGKSRRLSDGKFAKGGKPPYGYAQVPVNGVDRKQGFTLKPHPTDAANLRQIQSWFCEGGVTYAARMATEARIPTPMATTDKRKNKAADWSPQRWSPVTVQHIIRNTRAYLGEMAMVFDGEPHTIKYEPVITLEEFAVIERRRKERTLKHRAVFLSTGFVDCICGEHIHQRNSHEKHYAQCANACGSMRQDQFEAVLWIMTVCRLVQIRQHERTVMGSADPYGPAVQSARGKVAGVQAEIGRLADMYLAGLDKATWKQKNDSLNQKLSLAQAEADQAQRDRDAHAQRRSNEQTVEARVGAVIAELIKGEPSLERKRAVLSDLLGGQRVVCAWPKRSKKGKAVVLSAYAEITLPAFGELPPCTVRTDGAVWNEMLGRVVGGMHVSTVDVGKGIETSEAALLSNLARAGGKVLLRKAAPDGSIRLHVSVPDSYVPE